MNRFFLPLGIFAALVLFLGIGLRLKPGELPSPLIGKSAPTFQLPQLHEPAENVSPQDMAGQVWLLNVWASWCVACRVEHPVLMDLAKQGVVPILGLNYKDAREDATRWLLQFGNPFQVSAFDADGRVGIDYGVYGVPETFVIDKRGVIRFKHVGPVTPEVIAETFLPLIKELNRA